MHGVPGELWGYLSLGLGDHDNIRVEVLHFGAQFRKGCGL